MATKISKRETMLAVAVGAILFLLVNAAVLRLVTQTRTRLLVDLEAKKQELASLQLFANDAGMWEMRDAWLKANQPTVENLAGAGVQLLEEIKQQAQAQGVLLEKPELGSTETTAVATVVPVTLETKSTWPALIDFLQKLQTPERFVVVDSSELKQDPEDNTQMRGKFRISRWFAPST